MFLSNREENFWAGDVTLVPAQENETQRTCNLISWPKQSFNGPNSAGHDEDAAQAKYMSIHFKNTWTKKKKTRNAITRSASGLKY